MDAYEKLANAIIIQAADDFRSYTKKLKTLKAVDTRSMDAKALAKYKKKLDTVETDIREVVAFFYSDWYRCLTDVEPDAILDRLRKECGIE